MLILALVLVAGDAGLSAAAAARPELRPSGQCTLVAVEALSSPAVKAAAAPDRGPIQVFPSATTLDLSFRTGVVPAAAGHEVRFRVFTPKGHLYQELRGQLGAAPLTHEARLPVAGTDVVMHSLYGTWSVSAHVDGAARPCSRSRAFTLAP